MMSWHSEVERFLTEKKFDRIVSFYEDLVENNPENIKDYIYLGLAYLLAGNQTEAQSIWFYLFTQENEELLALLSDILAQEAHRQLILGDKENAWLIRSYLKEINPDLINNILSLIDLEININKTFNFDKINEYGLLNLLENSTNFDFNLLWEVIGRLLLNLEEKALPVLEKSLKYIDKVDSCIDKLDMIARFFDFKNTDLAIKITQICLQFKPDDFSLLRNLFWYYLYGSYYEEALKIAEKIYNLNNDLAVKVYGNNLLLESLLAKNINQQLDIVISRYKNLLQQAINENKCFLPDGIELISKYLFRLEDNPQKNRKLHNQVANLYQQEVRKKYHPEKWWQNISREKNEIRKKIKVGYIAGTFKQHPVGWLSRWLFKYHNHEHFEIVIYLVGFVEDNVTRECFYPYCDQHYILPSSVEAIASQISQDNIDILIDVDSLTNNIICQVMCLKLAPIQVTWLGLDATGIPSIDYFIADPYILPNNAQEYYQEKIWRLPSTYIAINGYNVGIPELRRQDWQISADAIIYLSIQTGWKKNENNLRLQMRIIKEVKNSYFFIQCNPNHERILQIASEEGINCDRIKFLPFFPPETYRANLQIVDIFLDNYPFNGATTTLDLLWMEKPIVTKVGEQFHARQGYTFLNNLGITEGIAWNDEEYIKWGIKLGKNEDLRKKVTWQLRESKKISPLWNGKQFAKEMEKAYQEMWQIYLDKI